jgi:hypothetical protein
MWVVVSCLVWGHEDRIHHSAARVYLACAACGRETPGWQLSPHPEPLSPPRTSRGWTGFGGSWKSLLAWRRVIVAWRASGAQS